MGQAWCKEKSTKAQDSKSPLDRVFLRCAHRIYPGLKEEGSVLGGATQRVTSSEIGYASSPPREVLTRGQSIDSVDRPFHPNDWVDVNLEVPGTPRASSMMTNLTCDASLYPPATHTSMNSSGSYLRDFTPVPPPRRRKKNRGRPLPPKPGDVSRSHVDRVTTKNCSKESRNSCHEPLYSSVKSHKTKTGEKEVFKHKVNGTGRVIPSIVLAANRSNGEKSIRGEEHRSNTRPKNSSTVSLPNYTELEGSNDAALCEDEGELKVYKITAAESLPSLITSGALENVKKSYSKKKEDRTIETDNHDKSERQHSVDEVDFSFEETKKDDILNSIMKLEEPMLTSTPVKNDVENDSRTLTSAGGWFLHHDRAQKSDEPEDIPMKNTEKEDDSGKSEFHDSTQSSRLDVFFEAEENLLEGDNRTSIERAVEVETEKQRMKTRASLKRTLSNESEPFDSYEEKELREPESTAAVLRLNSHVKLLGRSISKESLPREMFDDPDETDFFMNDKQSSAKENTIDNTTQRKVAIEDSIKSDTETPQSVAEPKIKPQIFDNDHSRLLKVLHDEAEESNLSSMTPSLTELEAALSDMLEREVDQEKSEIEKTVEIAVPTESNEAEKSLEKLIEPKIVVEKNIKKSTLPVSLKNILGDSEDSPNLISSEEKSVGIIEDNSMVEIDLKNGDKYSGDKQHELVEIAWNNSSRATILALQPPEKPSRLHQISLEDTSENSGAIPTPPRRRNRSSASGHSTTVLRENVRRTSERTVTPEVPYPNDRLI